MKNNTLLNIYLVEPIGAFRIIKGNQSLIAETNHPLAAVQVWQGEQPFTEHGHKASSREPQCEPAMGGDGLLSPRYDKVGKHWSKLC